MYPKSNPINNERKKNGNNCYDNVIRSNLLEQPIYCDWIYDKRYMESEYQSAMVAMDELLTGWCCKQSNIHK